MMIKFGIAKDSKEQGVTTMKFHSLIHYAQAILEEF